MKTQSLGYYVEGIFIHLQIIFFIRHPVDHWYSEAAPPIIACQTINAATFFPSHGRPPGEQKSSLR